MSKHDMGSIIHIKNQWNILVIGNNLVNYQNYQNLMLLTSSDTKRTLMHLLLFTNSAQRELVLICTQSIHNRNWLSLPYILGFLLQKSQLMHTLFMSSLHVSTRFVKQLNLTNTVKNIYIFRLFLAEGFSSYLICCRKPAGLEFFYFWD